MNTSPTVSSFKDYSAAVSYNNDLYSQGSGGCARRSENENTQEALKLLGQQMDQNTQTYTEKLGVHGRSIYWRVVYKYPLAEAYKQEMSPYFLPNQSILEIGAGSEQPPLIKEVGFNDVVRSKFQTTCKWTFSDLTYSRSSDHSQIPLDITQIPSEELANSFDSIVGNSVLDVIDYQKLPLVLANMYQLVKEEGFFIHFADLPLYTHSFVNACTLEPLEPTKKWVLLPAGPYMQQLYRIEYTDYKSVLKEQDKQLTQQERGILLAWGEQPLESQIAMLSQTKSLAFIFLAERIKSIFEKSTMTLSNVQALFEKHLKAAAQATGWEIVKCEYVVGESIEPPYPCEESNDWYLRQGYSTDSTEYSQSQIPCGKIRRRADVHVFIAKRPKAIIK